MHVPTYFGVDVDSRFLVTTQYDCEGSTSLANTPKAIQRWLSSLPPGAVVAMEATSQYHLPLALAAHAAGVTTYVIHPRDLKHYARGLGRRGKTDAMDAWVIARYAAKENDKLYPFQPLTPQEQALQTCQRERNAIARARTQLQQSLSSHGPVNPALRPLMKQLAKDLKAADRRILDCIRAHAPYQALAKRLRSVPGFGALVAAGLVQGLLRRPFRSADAWIASTGLDPRPNDSGKRSGQRHLSKRGPGRLRQLLYMAAMTFARTPLGLPLFQHYTNRTRLSTTAAYNVIARLLARVAWTLHRNDARFDPERFAHDHKIAIASA